MKNPEIFWSGMILSSLLCITTSFAQNAQTLSDAEVASVAVVANQIDIAYAEISKEKAKDAEILKSAETMINDHNAVIKRTSDLVKKLGVTRKDNDVSKKLLSDADATKNTLRSKSGSEFNKAFIDNEVAHHK